LIRRIFSDPVALEPVLTAFPSISLFFRLFPSFSDFPLFDRHPVFPQETNTTRGKFAVFLVWHPTSPSFPVCHRFCALFELHFPLFSYLPPLFPYLPPENGGQLGKAVKTSSRVTDKTTRTPTISHYTYHRVVLLTHLFYISILINICQYVISTACAIVEYGVPSEMRMSAGVI